MTPELERLSEKYAGRLLNDPIFSLKVKTLAKVMKILAPERDSHQVVAEAYMLACALEEMNV